MQIKFRSNSSALSIPRRGHRLINIENKWPVTACAVPDNGHVLVMDHDNNDDNDDKGTHTCVTLSFADVRAIVAEMRRMDIEI